MDCIVLSFSIKLAIQLIPIMAPYDSLSTPEPPEVVLLICNWSVTHLFNYIFFWWTSKASKSKRLFSLLFVTDYPSLKSQVNEAGTYVAANRLTGEHMEMHGRRWGRRALIILSAGIASSRHGTSVFQCRRLFLRGLDWPWSSRGPLKMRRKRWGIVSVGSEWFWLFLGCSFTGFFIHFLLFPICGF